MRVSILSNSTLTGNSLALIDKDLEAFAFVEWMFENRAPEKLVGMNSKYLIKREKKADEYLLSD